MSALDAAGYRRCLDKMLAGARAWVSACGTDGLTFTLPPRELGVIAPLQGRVIAMLGATEKARAFLRALDEATQHEGTVMQACAVVHSLGFPVEDWSEGYCDELVSRGGVPS